MALGLTFNYIGTRQYWVSEAMLFLDQAISTSFYRISHRKSCLIPVLFYQFISMLWNFRTWLLFFQYLSRLMTKPAKWLCTQRRLRSAWVSAQSDQSLRWTHSHFVGFVMKRLICLLYTRLPSWNNSACFLLWGSHVHFNIRFSCSISSCLVAHFWTFCRMF